LLELRNTPEYIIYLLLGANSGVYLLIHNVRHKYFQVEIGYMYSKLPKNIKRNLNIFRIWRINSATTWAWIYPRKRWIYLNFF